MPMRSPSNGPKRLAAAAALFVALGVAGPVAAAGDEKEADPTAAESTPHHGKAGEAKPDGQVNILIFKLDPFIVPLIEDGRTRRRFTLIIDLELYDANERSEVWHKVPYLRDGIYQLLFRTVTFRTLEPRVPDKRELQRRLLVVARKAVGEKRVKSVVIRYAAAAKTP